MNALLAFAAVVVFGVGLAHSYLGERYILMRLFRRGDLPTLFGSEAFMKRVLRLAWHVTSIAWWGFGALFLAIGAGASPRELLVVGAATFAASAALSFGLTRGRHFSWVAFFAIAIATGLAWAGWGSNI